MKKVQGVLAPDSTDTAWEQLQYITTKRFSEQSAAEEEERLD